MEKKIKAIREFRDKNESLFLKKKGVVGVGTGLKEKGGVKTDQLSLRIYVSRKMKPGTLDPADQIPEFITVDNESVPTDVVEVGHVMPHTYTQEMRPVPNGISIGHYAVTAGTKGALAIDNTNGKVVILSNNHVLANSNAGKAGDPILQPAVYDGGSLERDKVATLTRFQVIDFENPANTVDGAIATPIDQAVVDDAFMSPEIGASDPVVGLLFAGSPTHSIINPIGEVLKALNISLKRSVCPAELNMNVHKCGRTTEYSSATVSDIDATIQVTYEGGVATFIHQIITGPMSKGGDSGALVLKGGPGGSTTSSGVDFFALVQCCTLDPGGPGCPAGSGFGSDTATQTVDEMQAFRDNTVLNTTEGKRLLDLFGEVEHELLSIINSQDLEVQAVMDKHRPVWLDLSIAAIRDVNAGGNGKNIADPKFKESIGEMMRVIEKKGSKKMKDAIKQARKEKLWKNIPASLRDAINSL